MKYIRKKIIKGREYYYFEFAFKVHSKRVAFTRYLGKELPPNEELKSKIKGYFEGIGQIVAEQIITKDFPPNGVNTIEKYRAWYHYLSHELCEMEFRQFRDLFIVLFVLNSNRAEGSRVTREDIEAVMERRKKPKTMIDKEILNSLDAINFAFADKMKWNMASVKKIHRLLLSGIDDTAGKYKVHDNVIGSGIASITTPKGKVKGEMKKLMEWFNRKKKTDYPPALALEFHWRFEQIHPFQDGNGRVGRILLNAWLLDSFFMPVIFFSENHISYSSAIAKSIETRKNKLGKYFVEQAKKTYKRVEDYKREGIIKGGSPRIGRWEIQKGRIRVF